MIVPTLGERPESLRRCLHSIRSQSVPCQVVVIATKSASDLCIDGDLFDEFIQLGRRGLSRAIRAGEEVLDKDIGIFGWLGDDDYLTPESLSLSSAKLKQVTDASFSTGAVVYENSAGETLRKHFPRRLPSFLLPYVPNQFAQPGSLFSRSAYKEVHGVDVGLNFSMDLDLFLKLSRIGKPAIVDEEVAHYVWDRGTLSSENIWAAELESIQTRLRHTPPPLKLCNLINLHTQVRLAMVTRKLGLSSLK